MFCFLIMFYTVKDLINTFINKIFSWTCLIKVYWNDRD